MTDDEREDWERIRWAMPNEGFDYCFTGYSNWDEIKDENLHMLIDAYCEAKIQLEKYILEKYAESQLI